MLIILAFRLVEKVNEVIVGSKKVDAPPPPATSNREKLRSNSDQLIQRKSACLHFNTLGGCLKPGNTCGYGHYTPIKDSSHWNIMFDALKDLNDPKKRDYRCENAPIEDMNIRSEWGVISQRVYYSKHKHNDVKQA